MLQEEGAVAIPTINDSILDPESYLASSSENTTKPKDADE